MANPVYVAVDTADHDAALALLLAVRDRVGGLKLGLEYFCGNGAPGVKALLAHQPPALFLDLKLHDIPNTVAGALRGLAHAGIRPDILTVHAGGGGDMMRAARDAADPATRIVGVTVMTSLDAADLAATGVNAAPADQVRRLADLARESGLDGIVCSAHEAAAMRALWPEALLVVPGIRPAGSAVGDQKRVMTPRQAIDAGASVLVIGRPISAAADPAAAAAAIAAEVA